MLQFQILLLSQVWCPGGVPYLTFLRRVGYLPCNLSHGVYDVTPLPYSHEQIDAYENITFPQKVFADGNDTYLVAIVDCFSTADDEVTVECHCVVSGTRNHKDREMHAGDRYEFLSSLAYRVKPRVSRNHIPSATANRSRQTFTPM